MDLFKAYLIRLRFSALGISSATLVRLCSARFSRALRSRLPLALAAIVLVGN